MYAITTKYLGPTNTRGSRVKATDTAGRSITVSYDGSLPGHGAHSKAASMLAKQREWLPEFAGERTTYPFAVSQLPDGRGYVFVEADPECDLETL